MKKTNSKKISLIFFGFLIPFFIIELIKPKKKNFKNNYQNYCKLSPPSYSSSNKRDVVLFSADSFHPGLELAIKTLRSSGCLCRIILLSSKKISIPHRSRKIFNELDVEIKDDCKNPDPSREYIPHMLRFELELNWLLENEKDIDRVFHSDAFDVMFQKDPFGSEITTKELLFILEPHCFRSCGWNLAWMKQCYGEEIMRDMMTNFIICSGSIIGGIKPYIKLLKLMINQKEWKSCWGSSLDQPILNYLVWSGKVKDSGINFDFTGCNGNYLTMQWCLLNQVVYLDQENHILSEENTIPAFVHQYNRNKTLLEFLYQKCNVISFK